MTKKIYLLLFSIIGIITIASCTEKTDTVKLTIASEKRLADAGATTMEVFQVKEGDEQEWTYFYNTIDGFTYEPGYEYVLEVKKETLEEPIPADASSIKYTLVKEVSKTEKTSENMLKGIEEEVMKEIEKLLETVAEEATEE